MTRCLCAAEEICVDVATVDGFDSLITNYGTYDAATSEICFTPTRVGSYELIATVVDSCGREATDTVVIGVTFNQPPVITPLPDTSIYLCWAQWFCLDLEVTDADNDLVSVTVNDGMITEDGRVCFVPYTGGEYDVIVTAVDSCGNTAVDTAHVTVLTDEGIELVCPGDTTVFTCSLVDTFCFPVTGIPDYAEVSVTGLNAWYNADDSTVCYSSECGNTKHH